MKKIPLTQGYEALVDDEDFEWLNQWKWHAFKIKEHRTVYAKRGAKLDDGRKANIQMHRALLNPPSHLQIDHMDGNGLNNQKANLRIVTCQENQRNRQLSLNNRSGIKGVSWNKTKNKWKVDIMVNNKNINLGCYHSLYTAAKVRKEAEIKYGFFDREAIVGKSPEDGSQAADIQDGSLPGRNVSLPTEFHQP